MPSFEIGKIACPTHNGVLAHGGEQRQRLVCALDVTGGSRKEKDVSTRARPPHGRAAPQTCLNKTATSVRGLQ